jgi:expansin (peptidoglycan-binding protein)
MKQVGLLLVMIAACGGSSLMAADDAGPLAVDAPVGPTCTAPPAAATGQATYYNADGTGSCSFDASTDFHVAAMNATDYGNADWCGACVQVTGPSGSTVVRIVDKCPGCAKGDLDLSQTAFGELAPLSAGRIAITWHEVACDVTGPIGYHFKAGDTKFYTPIQIRNARYPVAKLEVQQGGAYVAIPRVDYNYFVPSAGLGDGPFALRTTDTRGHVVEDGAIALGDGVTRDGAAQFPVCP